MKDQLILGLLKARNKTNLDFLNDEICEFEKIDTIISINRAIEKISKYNELALITNALINQELRILQY